MASKVITMHIGQSGVQISYPLWELLCMEHFVNPDGEKSFENTDYENISSFFQEINNGRYMPRAVMIDSEPTVIEEIKTGAYRNLFSCNNMIYGFEDSANNFARANFMVGSKFVKPLGNCLAKMFEQTEYVERFLIINSMGGGTGSGLTALILEKLLIDYPKTNRIQLAIFPSPTMTNAIVEPYNSILHGHSTMDSCELSILSDNEALYDMCRKLLHMNSPTFTKLNNLLSIIISSWTSNMRFYSSLNCGVKEMYTNLIPYPRIHHTVVRHAPMENKFYVSYDKLTVESITKSVMGKDYQAIKCNCSFGKFISVVMNYRGAVNPNEISQVIHRYRNNLNVKFVDWSPTGFKIGLNNQTPSFHPESEFGYSDKSVTLIGCTTAIRHNWLNLCRKFDMLFLKRSFVHWFIGEGLEESEFGESRIDIEMLCEDYYEIGLSDDELIALRKNSKSRSTVRSLDIQK